LRQRVTIGGLLLLVLTLAGAGRAQGGAAPGSLETILLDSAGTNMDVGVIDSARGYAYFGTSVGVLARVRLSDLSREGTIGLPAGYAATAAAIDRPGGYAYFAISTGNDMRVLKIHLDDFVQVDQLDFPMLPPGKIVGRG
jgi:hypothetical protein